MKINPRARIIILLAILAAAGEAVARPQLRQPAFDPRARDITDGFAAFETPDVPAPFGWFVTFDAGEALASVTVDGKPGAWLGANRSFWPGAERGVFLPTGRHHTVAVPAPANRILYPNGFGRVTLAPATIGRALALAKGAAPGEVAVRNFSPLPQRVAATVLFTDFFGAPLGAATNALAVAPGARVQIRFAAPKAYWRATYRLSAAGETSAPYCDYPEPNAWFTARAEVVPFEGAFPASFDPPKEKVRTKDFTFSVDVPTDWGDGRRILVGVPDVSYRADFRVKGRAVGTLFRWETPAKIDVTDFAIPGERLTLAATVTDASVCAAAGWKGGKPGEPPTGRRMLAAAVGHFPGAARSGFTSRLVLLSEPSVRTDRVLVRPQLAADGTKTLACDFVFRNDTAADRAERVACSVQRDGADVCAFPAFSVTIPAGASVTNTVTFPADALAFWTPETPVLHTLLTRLADDTHRARFGFRTLGIDGAHFTLNGAPVRFWGFSQIFLPFFYTWPAVPHAANFLRWHFHNDSYNMGGARYAHLADELGYFVKAENMSHNAHHNERYDYGDERMWARLLSEHRRIFETLGNAPSIAFWDVGNELFPSQSGEPERMGRFLGELRALDPTRLVTVSGCLPRPVGPDVRINDTHGHVRMGGDADFLADADRPWLFSECMYLYAHLLPGFCGDEALTLPPGEPTYMKFPALLGRRHMIRSGRLADVAAALGHVARYHGRELSPVAAFVRDGRTRFRAGEPIVLACEAFNSVSHGDTLDVTLELRESGRAGARPTPAIARATRRVTLGPYGHATLAFEFPSIETREDRRLALFVDVVAAGGAIYRDCEEVAVYAEYRPTVPAGTRLFVYDPAGCAAARLTGWGVPFARVKTAEEWTARRGETLLAFAGGKSFPTFAGVASPEIQKAETMGVCPYGELAVAFTPRDLRFWYGGDRARAVTDGTMPLPTSGSFRILAGGAYEDGVKTRTTPLYERPSGEGTVRYCTFDLSGPAREAAAERLLAWLVSHPPEPFGADGVATLVSPRLGRILSARGVRDVRTVEAFPRTAPQENPLPGELNLPSLRRLVTDGATFASLRPCLESWLRGGGALLILDAPKGAAFALDRARIVKADPLLAGIPSGDFFWYAGKEGTNRSIPVIDETKPLAGDRVIATHLADAGEPLVRPAYVTREAVGSGAIYRTTLGLFSGACPEADRLLSILLTNFGLSLADAGESARAVAVFRDTSKMLPLKDILPGFNPSDVLSRVEWGDYGMVVARDGSIPLVYRRSDGRPFVSLGRWAVQERRDRDGTPHHRGLEFAPATGSVALPRDRTADADADAGAGDGNGFKVSVKGAWAASELTVTLRPDGFTLDLSYEALRSPDASAGINFTQPLKFLGGAEWRGGVVNVRPLTASWNDMLLSLDYNSTYRWHSGYTGEGKDSLTFWPFNAKGSGPFAAGVRARTRLTFDFR